MAEIEHEIISRDDGQITLVEDFPSNQFLVFDGCDSKIVIQVNEDHLQSLTNQLNEWGYKPSSK